MAVADVVVVGAGPAGLAAASTLRASGIHSLVIERAETVGSAWRTRYDNFRLHTARRWSALPGMAIPSSYGPWVSRDDFLQYLQDYSERFGIAPDFGVELRGLSYAGGRGLDTSIAGGRPLDTSYGGSWRLDTSRGEVTASHVVFATGSNNEPYIPAWPGRDSFTGTLIHSSEYRNPAGYAGRRVLVVGSGNSASEIAADLASTGNVQVEMAVRTPPTILRRDIYGVPTQLVGIATRPLPPGVINALAATTRRLSIPNLTEYGLPAPSAPYTQFQRTGTLPLLDHGFISALRSGAIPVRTGVRAMTSDAVVHSGGAESRPDVVIAATGYRAGLDAILGPLGLADANGRPAFGPRGGTGLARGLYAVGVDVVLSGMLREAGKDAARVAQAINRAVIAR
ncbi:MAG: putative oxidoreductase [Frankiales bacterium]|nr:putative oxidoreductase [Frankiales bacterium]